jgi:hypothetical protein
MSSWITHSVIPSILIVILNPPFCHPERSEGSRFFGLRPQNDTEFKFNNLKQLIYIFSYHSSVILSPDTNTPFVILSHDAVGTKDL